MCQRCVGDVSERVGDDTVQLSHQLATLHLQQLHIINEMCQRCVGDVSEGVGDDTVQLSHQLATLHL